MLSCLFSRFSTAKELFREYDSGHFIFELKCGLRNYHGKHSARQQPRVERYGRGRPAARRSAGRRRGARSSGHRAGHGGGSGRRRGGDRGRGGEEQAGLPVPPPDRVHQRLPPTPPRFCAFFQCTECDGFSRPHSFSSPNLSVKRSLTRARPLRHCEHAPQRPRRLAQTGGGGVAHPALDVAQIGCRMMCARRGAMRAWGGHTGPGEARTRPRPSAPPGAQPAGARADGRAPARPAPEGRSRAGLRRRGRHRANAAHLCAVARVVHLQQIQRRQRRGERRRARVGAGLL